MFTIKISGLPLGFDTLTTDDPFGAMADLFDAFPSLVITSITQVGR